MSEYPDGPWTIADAEIHVDPTGDRDPFTISASNADHGIESVELEPRMGEEIDQGEVILHNHDGRYRLDGEQRITRGDKLSWHVALAGEDELTERWAGMVETPDYERLSVDESYLHLEVEDFVFSTLSDRIVYRVFSDELVEDIIEQLVELKAPELDVDLVSTGVETDLIANGLNLLETISSLAQRADCILTSDGETLVLERIVDLSSQWSLVGNDVGGEFNLSESSDDLTNFVRVDGGNAATEDDVQEDQTAYETVTNTNPLLQRLTATRSQFDRIEVWTRDTGADESIRVRLQRDVDGAPKDPSSRRADIARAQLTPTDGRFADEEWSVFFLDDHNLHDQDPWLIIDTNGDEGIDVGVNNSDEATFRAFYQYPIIAEASDPNSIREYGRIETSITDESIRKMTVAGEIADTQARRYNEPRRELTASAMSNRLRTLGLGEVVTANWARDGAVGDFVLSGRHDQYYGDSNQLRSDVTLQHVDSL